MENTSQTRHVAAAWTGLEIAESPPRADRKSPPRSPRATPEPRATLDAQAVAIAPAAAGARQRVLATLPPGEQAAQSRRDWRRVGWAFGIGAALGLAGAAIGTWKLVLADGVDFDTGFGATVVLTLGPSALLPALQATGTWLANRLRYRAALERERRSLPHTPAAPEARLRQLVAGFNAQGPLTQDGVGIAVRRLLEFRQGEGAGLPGREVAAAITLLAGGALAPGDAQGLWWVLDAVAQLAHQGALRRADALRLVDAIEIAFWHRMPQQVDPDEDLAALRTLVRERFDDARQALGPRATPLPPQPA